MYNRNKIQVKVYCIQRGSSAEILTEEEIWEDFDEWMIFYLRNCKKPYFEDWCDENNYDKTAEDWDDIQDQAWDEFYDYACDYLFDELWEEFVDENLLAERTIIL